MAHWWTGSMDILGSMKSRHCIKHWIYKKHQENNILFTTVWNSSIFRVTAWTFQPALTSCHCSQEHWWTVQIPVITKLPSVRALCNLISQQKEPPALQCNGKAYAVFLLCRSGHENLNLFAKLCFGNCGKINFVLNPGLKLNWAGKSLLLWVFLLVGFFQLVGSFLGGVWGFFWIQPPTVGLVTCIFPFPPGNSSVTTAHLQCCSDHVCTCGCVRSRQSGKMPKYLKSSLFIFQYTGCCNKGYYFSLQTLLSLYCTHFNELVPLYPPDRS